MGLKIKNKSIFFIKFFLITLISIIISVIGVYYLFLPYNNLRKDSFELTALTTALYWEGAVNESNEGLHAIAWVIFNRKNSDTFPNTIQEVIIQGVKKNRKTGCQFSFACDKEDLLPSVLEKLRPKDVKQLGFLGYQRRWLKYLFFSFTWLYINKGKDPTDGAMFYFTGKKPYWYKALDPDSIKKIGSHTFGKMKDDSD